MNKKIQLVVGGAAIGLFLGLSTGVAMQGTAYNGAVVFAPLGAFIGWLISSISGKKDEDPAPTDNVENKIDSSPSFGDTIATVYTSILTILATIWNFHIDLLDMMKLLPVFQEKPWLFLVLAVVISVFFPPFLVLYFVCYLGAAHFGIKDENGYRSDINQL